MAVEHSSTHDGRTGATQDDIRRRTADLLDARRDALAADAVSILLPGAGEALDSDYCRRLASLLIELFAESVRQETTDPRGGLLDDLHALRLERGLPIARLFAFAYLTERSALDDLAVNHAIGATSEPWPLVAQLVRRASFDCLAGYVERITHDPGRNEITEPMTRLYTRALFDLVLSKEIERASRRGGSISLLLFDLDHLSTLNQTYGRGVGDRILERLGALMRTFFRHHDWVARHADDSVIVLMAPAEADRASDLADQARKTIEARLTFLDHRTDRPVAVTASAAILNLTIRVGDVVDPVRILTDVEVALARAKQFGRNRIERLDHHAPHPSAGPGT
jgi:diguanylate cyclase (GGDEF)-like protein